MYLADATHPSPILDGRGPSQVGESAAHVERVSAYSGLLAAALGADPELIRPASRLHDCGQLVVPLSILHKPGRLTRDERAIVAEHARVGHRLLAGSGTALMDCAATIAWTHHERVDGSGYPRGLRGDEIPLEGRIVAVADVFDALTNWRPYRPAMSVTEALAVLRDDPLDRDVVMALLEQLDAILDLRAQFAEPAPEAEMPSGEAVKLHEAAETLGMSPSRLRRWADAGRIRCTRTIGGHRRFPISEVQRLARERGLGVAVLPTEPPAVALPRLATLLEDDGEQLAAMAAAATYRHEVVGWFGANTGASARVDWLHAVADAVRVGDYPAAIQANEAFLHKAQLHGAGVLERHSFVERFSATTIRGLMQHNVSKDELFLVRRLFVALAQAHLSEL